MTGLDFTYGDHNKMGNPLAGSQTTIASFLQIGALALTATGSDEQRNYATDQTGMETAAGVCHDILASFHAMSSALGALLAEADHQEVESNHLREIGWLLMWLTEGAQFVETELRVLKKTIERMKCPITS